MAGGRRVGRGGAGEERKWQEGEGKAVRYGEVMATGVESSACACVRARGQFR